MFGSLLDDIDVAKPQDSLAAETSETAKQPGSGPMSIDSGSVTASFVSESKTRKQQQQQQQRHSLQLSGGQEAPDLSSAEEDYKRKKKRRQQNSKRLGQPDPRLLEGKQIHAAMGEVAEASTGHHPVVQIKPLHDFLVDHPHLANDMKSKGERCVGVAPEDKKDAVPVPSNDTKDGCAQMDTNADGKQQQQQQQSAQVHSPEEILKEPEEFALLREAMANIPNIRWLLSDAMLRQRIKPEECMQYLHEKRARLPESTASHENLLIAEAGTFISTAPGAQPGKLYTFPPCVCGPKCVGVTEPVSGLPPSVKGRVLTKYMNAVEFAELLRSGTSPAAERMCRDCYVATIAMLVYNVRGYSMHEPSSSATHALAQQQLLGLSGNSGKSEPGRTQSTNQTSFGGDSELHGKCNASLVRMADTLCLNPFTNLCNQEDGYIADCMLLADGKQYEGVLGNVVRFRASYRRWQFNEKEKRWYMSQDAMIWHPPENASDFEIDIGDSVHHF